MMTEAAKWLAPEGAEPPPEQQIPAPVPELILPDSVQHPETELGRLGPPVNRRAPFYIGFVGALGVAAAYLLVRAVVDARTVLLVVGVALFLAIGLNPAVLWLCRHGVGRTLASVIVVVVLLAFVGGFIAAAVPPSVAEFHSLVVHWPKYRSDLLHGRGAIGRLAVRLHLSSYTSATGLARLRGHLLGGLFGGAKLVLSALAATAAVLALTVYFTIALPAVRHTFLEVIPRTRRERVAAMTDEVFDRVGGFVLGNIATSVIAAVGTFLWLIVWHVPYPLLLAMFVAIFDLIPIVGSTIAGIVVSFIALSVSLAVAIATAVFYVAYRLAEDYVITPRVMNRTVHISPGVTIIATLIGGVLLGLVGALVAIPVAATLNLLHHEVMSRQAERS